MAQEEDYTGGGFASYYHPVGIPILAGAEAVRWYPFLIAKPGEPGRAALFERERVSASDFLVCIETENLSKRITWRPPDAKFSTPKSDKPGKLFAKFSSPLRFYSWMMRHVPAPLRSCYEIVRGQTLQKPYFDIDLAFEEATSAGLTEEDVGNAVRELGARAQLVAGVDSSQFIIFSSHSKTKYSFHLIVTGVVLASHREARLFAKITTEAALAARVPKTVVSAADFGIYSATQQFRVTGCQKYLSGRVKAFRQDLSDWRVPEGCRRPGVKIFMESLVTNTSACEPPPKNSIFARALAEEEETLRSVRERDLARWAGRHNPFARAAPHPSHIGGDEAAAALELVREKLLASGAKSAPFSLRDPFGPFAADAETGACLVPLNRDAPSFCPTCRRDHETENPFMTIWCGAEGTWHASFCCRRSDRKTIVSLGDEFITVQSELEPINCAENHAPTRAPPRLTREFLGVLESSGRAEPAALERVGSDDLYRSVTTLAKPAQVSAPKPKRGARTQTLTENTASFSLLLAPTRGAKPQRAKRAAGTKTDRETTAPSIFPEGWGDRLIAELACGGAKI